MVCSSLQSRMPGRPPQQPTSNYLNAVLTGNNNNNLQRSSETVRLLNQTTTNSNCFSVPVSIDNSLNLNNNTGWQNNNLDSLQMLNDPLLSDILDEVSLKTCTFIFFTLRLCNLQICGLFLCPLLTLNKTLFIGMFGKFLQILKEKFKDNMYMQKYIYWIIMHHFVQYFFSISSGNLTIPSSQNLTDFSMKNCSRWFFMSSKLTKFRPLREFYNVRKEC